MKIRTVTVVGATGTMGNKVAAIFASFSNARVFMVARDPQKVNKSIASAADSVRADSILKNLVPAGLSSLENCVKQSDLIFESVSENIETKKSIALRIASAMPDHAVSCTGSSGLSVTQIAQCYPKHLRSRVFGVHMFNPPYSLSLCELCPTTYSDETLKDELKEYLCETLLREVVEVKDAPAFMANRIGFHFINKAMLLAQQYKDSGGVDYIDAILGPFTGRSMPPLMTADFVGLDVHKAIVDNIFENTNDFEHNSFLLPEFASKLIEQGRLGRKSSQGLYRFIRSESGHRRSLVYDINTGEYRERMNYVFTFAERMKDAIMNGDYQKALYQLVNNKSSEARLCLEFQLDYIVYALYCAKTVGSALSDADAVMAEGFNWCPPLALFEALSSVCDCKKLILENCRGIDDIDIAALLDEAPASRYDYRKYFKSGRKPL